MYKILNKRNGLFTSLVEYWKPINGYSDRYLISSFGNVYSIVSNKMLKQKINSSGYATVHLRGTVESHQSVHRLIALHFIKNEEQKQTVNHVDGVKLNNKISNLEWSTHAEQVRHALDSNLIEPRGEHKYSPEFKLSVKNYYEINNCSIKELARIFKISERSAGRFILFNERPVKIKDSDIAVILQLRENGETLKSISQKFDCGISQIHRIVKGLSRNVKYER